MEARYNLLHYDLKIVDGECILTPRNIPPQPIPVYISEEMLLDSVKHSVIQECTVRSGKFIISTERKYRRIWKDIVLKFHNLDTFLKVSDFNIQPWNESEKGYSFIRKLGFSFQGKDAKGTMKDILKLCCHSNLSIELSIKTKDGIILRFNSKQ